MSEATLIQPSSLSSNDDDDDLISRHSILGFTTHCALYMALSFPSPISHTPAFFHAFIISEAFGLCVALGCKAFRPWPRLRSRLHCIGTAHLASFTTSPGASYAFGFMVNIVRLCGRRL